MGDDVLDCVCELFICCCECCCWCVADSSKNSWKVYSQPRKGVGVGWNDTSPVVKDPEQLVSNEVL